MYSIVLYEWVKISALLNKKPDLLLPLNLTRQ